MLGAVNAQTLADLALMEMWSERFSSDGGWMQWIVVRPTTLFSYAAAGWKPPSREQD
jgi:hypothetical protein